MTETLTPLSVPSTANHGPTPLELFETRFGTTRVEIPRADTQHDTESSVDASVEQDIREVSPNGAALLRVANRLNGFLEKRARNKANTEALREDTARTTQKQDEAFATYEDNVQYSQDHETALSMNEKYDQKQRRKEELEEAKEKIRGFGRAALLLTIGTGLIVGESAARGIRSGADKVTEYSSAAKEAAVYKKQSLARTQDKLLTKKYEQDAKLKRFKAESEAKARGALHSGRERTESAKDTLRRANTARKMGWFIFKDHLKAPE